MSHEFSEKNFMDWLIVERQLSNRAARDVLSRLRRSQNLVATEDFNNLSSYENELNKNLETSEIPESSQKGMLRAVRLFYQFTI